MIMPYRNGRFDWTRDESAADITSGRYGEEHDDRLSELINFENGVRKLWADRLRKLVEEDSDGFPAEELGGILRACRLLDPYNPQGAAEGFGRTEPVGQAGTLWFGPEKGSEES